MSGDERTTSAADAGVTLPEGLRESLPKSWLNDEALHWYLRLLPRLPSADADKLHKLLNALKAQLDEAVEAIDAVLAFDDANDATWRSPDAETFRVALRVREYAAARKDAALEPFTRADGSSSALSGVSEEAE